MTESMDDSQVEEIKAFVSAFGFMNFTAIGCVGAYAASRPFPSFMFALGAFISFSLVCAVASDGWNRKLWGRFGIKPSQTE